MTVLQLRKYFTEGNTLDVKTRLSYLSKLELSIERHTDEILTALSEDLGKASFEAYAFEVAPVLHEIEVLQKNLKKWLKDEKVNSPLLYFRGRTKIIRDPYGVVLIIAPWNYPFHLLMMPLIGAVACGNVVLAKPSRNSPATTKVIRKIISEVFPEEYVMIKDQILLSEKYDYIFFTGGTKTGTLIASAAAKYCTPITLELGGKNPCIVDKTADILVAAKRISWAKCANAGQTCVAPDYLLVHESVKDLLIEKISESIRSFYGENPTSSPDYPKIITDSEYERLLSYVNPKNILLQCGSHNPSERKFAPTLISAEWSDSVMHTEVFGPVLPVRTWREPADLLEEITITPLALYIFSRDEKFCDSLICANPSGGVCINDCMLQVANQNAPFGGVGSSGSGAYHGRFSVETFSRRRTVVVRKNFPEMNLRYPPYDEKKFGMIRKLRKKIF